MLPYYKNKSELRSAAKLEVKTISPEQKSSRSALIFKNILNSELIKDAKVVALYASLPDEVCTADIITALHSQKKILLPRVAGDEMDFYRYSPTEMSIGAFGISGVSCQIAVHGGRCVAPCGAAAFSPMVRPVTVIQSFRFW